MFVKTVLDPIILLYPAKYFVTIKELFPSGADSDGRHSVGGTQ
jgi:hypothetical protein